jgi:hypothetical protein
MTVEELIKELQKIEDKTLDVRVENTSKHSWQFYSDEENIWLRRVEVHHQGSSGYELDGEVILVGSE